MATAADADGRPSGKNKSNRRPTTPRPLQRLRLFSTVHLQVLSEVNLPNSQLFNQIIVVHTCAGAVSFKVVGGREATFACLRYVFFPKGRVRSDSFFSFFPLPSPLSLFFILPTVTVPRACTPPGMSRGDSCSVKSVGQQALPLTFANPKLLACDTPFGRWAFPCTISRISARRGHSAT